MGWRTTTCALVRKRSRRCHVVARAEPRARGEFDGKFGVECAVCWPREIAKGECSLRKMKIRDGLFLVPRARLDERQKSHAAELATSWTIESRSILQPAVSRVGEDLPIGLDRVTLARTPSLSTQHSPYQDGCFRCYHPFPQGARPERYPRASTERPARALRPSLGSVKSAIASVPEKKSPIRTPEGAPDARGDARRPRRPRPNARLNLPSQPSPPQVAFRGQTAELKRGKVVKVRIPASAAATSRVNSRQHGRARLRRPDPPADAER